MIYDEIIHAETYTGISDNVDNALKLLGSIDISKLSQGRNEIDGDNLFIMMFDYETIDASDAVYEAHKRYIDIQLVVKGKEVIRCYPKSLPTVVKPYDEEADVELYSLNDGLDVVLKPGVFVMLMPEEVHAPKITGAEQSDVTKIVVKIKI